MTEFKDPTIEIDKKQAQQREERQKRIAELKSGEPEKAKSSKDTITLSPDESKALRDALAKRQGGKETGTDKPDEADAVSAEKIEQMYRDLGVPEAEIAEMKKKGDLSMTKDKYDEMIKNLEKSDVKTASDKDTNLAGFSRPEKGREILDDISEDPRYKEIREETIANWEKLNGSRFDDKGNQNMAFEDFALLDLNREVMRDFQSRYPEDFVKYQKQEINGKFETEKPEKKYEPDEIISPKEPGDIERIKNELDRARKEYLDIDYKKNTGYKRVGRILGRFWTRDKEQDLLENDMDIAWSRAHYDNKLFEYKNALLEDVKRNGKSNKELGEILKIFETEAKINLADGHDQVKIENHEGKYREVLKNHLMNRVEEYKKLPLTYKIGIGLGFGLLGFAGAGAAAGGTAAIMIGAPIAIRRAFMGVVTGTSTALGMESLTKRRTEKKITGEVEKTTEEMKEMNGQEKMSIIEEKINKLIFDEENRIDTIKNKKLRNLTVGTTVGSIIGSGAMSHIMPYVYRFGTSGFSSMKSFLAGFGKKYSVGLYGTIEPNSGPSGNTEIPKGHSSVTGKLLPRPEIGENVSPEQTEPPKFPTGRDPFKPFIEESPKASPFNPDNPLGIETPAPENFPPEVAPGYETMPDSPNIEKSVPLGLSAENPYTSKNPIPEPKPLHISPEGKTTPIPQETSSGKTPISPETGKGKVLKIEKWENGKLKGSIDGIIKNNLIEQKVGRIPAGKEAAGMRLEFQQYIDKLKTEGKIPKRFSLNVVQPGAEIELSSDGKHIIGFKDGSGSRFTGHIRVEDGKVKIEYQDTPKGSSVHEETGKKIKSPREYKSDGPNTKKVLDNLEKAKGPAKIQETINPKGNIDLPDFDDSNMDINAPADQLSQTPPQSPTRPFPGRPGMGPGPMEMGPNSSRYAAEIDRRYGFNPADDRRMRMAKMVNGITRNNRGLWNRELRNIPFNGLEDHHPRVAADVVKLADYWGNHFHEKVPPLRRETIGDWVGRIVDRSINRQGGIFPPRRP